MLTKADDYPVHQTPDTIAHPGTDRNFYDRFFFCGWSADGQIYIATALGIYPNVDIIDGAFAIAWRGVQHSVFASRILHSERLDMQVGPLKLEILEPLKLVRFTVSDNDQGVTADFTFRSVLPPVEEERHYMRQGARTIFELTRMTIFGHYAGGATINNERVEFADFRGIRDRSWGVRQIGARDTQPLVPEADHRVMWIWSPLEFERISFLFVELAGASGQVFKRRAELVTDAGTEVLTDVSFAAQFNPATRRALWVRIRGLSASRGAVTVEATPEWEFPLVAVGYGHPTWMHGAYQGATAVHGEQRNLATLDPRAAQNAHVHAPARATMRVADQDLLHGRGVVEQIIFGAHPYPGLEA